MSIIVVMGLALGSGLLLQMIGLSIALGAFLAGLVIAEPPHRSQAISRVLPLRDVFAAIFFVSIGARFDPLVITRSLAPLLGLSRFDHRKALIGTVVTRLFRREMPTAILTGLLLAQVGEFAFILAMIGLERSALSQELFSVIMAAAVISIFVTR
jgi:CPA2 family monovalent cation:H+ antiporter-2